MKQLISSIVQKYAGKPILVIGGGPSVSRDLPRIPQDYPACVISANQHGFMQDRFKVDYIVNVDFTMSSSKEPMQKALGKYGVPTINRWHWADYRLPNPYTYSGDSGMTGIAVAVALGGHPVIFTGFDRNTGDRKYFWGEPPADRRVWELRQRTAARLNVQNNAQANQKILELTKGAQVRCLSGPMRSVFPLWDINEKLPSYQECKGMFICYHSGKPYRVKSPRLFLHPTDPIAQGTVLLLTEAEARGPLQDGRIVPA